MLEYKDITNYQISILDFNSIYKIIDKCILNHFYEYKLLDCKSISIKNNDIKKLLRHDIIHNVCNSFLKDISLYRKVIFVQPYIVSCDIELINYIDHNILSTFIKKTLDKLTNMLPLNIYFSKHYINLDCFPNCQNAVTGRQEEILLDIITMVRNNSKSNYTFQNIKKYADHNGLNFLSKDYFNSLETKVLMIK